MGKDAAWSVAGLGLKLEATRTVVRRRGCTEVIPSHQKSYPLYIRHWAKWYWMYQARADW
jgi:hypothetical protein